MRKGETQIRELLASDDTARMLEALKALGVSITQSGDNDYLVKGIGGQSPVRFPVAEADFFGQCRHGIPSTDGSLGDGSGALPTLRSAAYASAADR